MCNHIAKLCTCKGFSLYRILWQSLPEGPWEPLYQVIAFCSWICWSVLPFYQLDDLPWSFLWQFFAVYLTGLLSFMLFFLSSGAYIQVPFHELRNILICMLEAFKGPTGILWALCLYLMLWTGILHKFSNREAGNIEVGHHPAWPECGMIAMGLGGMAMSPLDSKEGRDLCGDARKGHKNVAWDEKHDWNDQFSHGLWLSCCSCFVSTIFTSLTVRIQGIFQSKPLVALYSISITRPSSELPRKCCNINHKTENFFPPDR